MTAVTPAIGFESEVCETLTTSSAHFNIHSIFVNELVGQGSAACRLGVASLGRKFNRSGGRDRCSTGRSPSHFSSRFIVQVQSTASSARLGLVARTGEIAVASGGDNASKVYAVSAIAFASVLETKQTVSIASCCALLHRHFVVIVGATTQGTPTGRFCVASCVVLGS